MNLSEIIIDRSPLEQAIHIETVRAELSELGFTVVKTDWLHRKIIEEQIRKRKLEVA